MAIKSYVLKLLLSVNYGSDSSGQMSNLKHSGGVCFSKCLEMAEDAFFPISKNQEVQSQRKDKLPTLL